MQWPNLKIGRICEVDRCSLSIGTEAHPLSLPARAIAFQPELTLCPLSTHNGHWNPEGHSRRQAAPTGDPIPLSYST